MIRSERRRTNEEALHGSRASPRLCHYWKLLTTRRCLDKRLRQPKLTDNGKGLDTYLYLVSVPVLLYLRETYELRVLVSRARSRLWLSG